MWTVVVGRMPTFAFLINLIFGRFQQLDVWHGVVTSSELERVWKAVVVNWSGIISILVW
jgi:hypothetical protein